MKENLKLGLLALIAVTLIINTWHEVNDDDVSDSHAVAAHSSNAAITPDNPAITPNEPIVDNRPKTSISFDEIEHDFGTIQQETENKKIFTFTNTGNEPLVISNAKGSCGCTVPNYPREPIPPGGTGEIEVVYSPGKQQNQQAKTVTITANTSPETTILKIKANVLPGETSAEG
jgi:hypothetical protein